MMTPFLEQPDERIIATPTEGTGEFAFVFSSATLQAIFVRRWPSG